MKLGFTNKEYTISVYKNELTGTREEREGIVYDSYYKQNKIAQIGSNQYKSPIDACTPKFSKNINGKKTLTFNMYYEYYDYDFGDFLINPFVGLIHNDTLIQLKYENEFYDFLVTKVQKDSENKVYSFTAEDSTIIELGKNGFNAELNIELENNMGTIKELGTEILKDSDWIVDPDSDLIVQTLEDSLYKISIELSDSDFIRRTNYLPDAYYIHDASIHDYSEQSINDNIYVFYNDVVDTTKDEIGFLYWGDESQVVLNADGVVVNSYNYVITNPTIVENIRKSTELALSLMRGYRVIRSPKTSYNHDLEKVINYFTKNGEETEYYGYAVTDYMTPVLTENYISNPCNMTTLYDWNYVNHGEKTNTRPKLLWQAMPRPECAPYVSYLKVEPNTEVINKGLQGHRSNLESFAYGDKFIIAFLARTDGYENYGVFPGEETSAMDITDGGQFKPTELQGLQYSMAFYRYKEPTQSDIIKFAELGEGQDIEVEEVLCSGTFVPNPNQSFTIEDTLFPGRSKIYYYNEFSYEGEPITDLTEHLDKPLGFLLRHPQKINFMKLWFSEKLNMMEKQYILVEFLREKAIQICARRFVELIIIFIKLGKMESRLFVIVFQIWKIIKWFTMKTVKRFVPQTEKNQIIIHCFQI